MKIIWQILIGFLLLVSALFFWLSPREKYQYKLAICAMFKNEAPWLAEWIAYHHDILGFEHFYLYDNDSTDPYREVLSPFIDRGIVELIDWNSADLTHRATEGDDSGPWLRYQIGAYNECLKKRALGKAKWVAMIDIDEFIVPVKGVRSFHAFLRTAEKQRKGSIKFSWRMFGTSHIWDLNPGELLTEKMTLRGADDNYSHNWGKCMHRPEAVKFCHIHDAGKLHEPFRFRHAKPDEFRIHHYWSRTEKACLEKRRLNSSQQNEFAEAFNCIEDTTIHQYLPRLKKSMVLYINL